MKVTELGIQGVLLIQPQIFEDERGYFVERFNMQAFAKASGMQVQFVQDNESMSNKGVVRGLHFQHGDMAQAKLVYVPRGAVNDIVLDLRKDSPSYLQHVVVPLNATNKSMLYLPAGMAHGFEVLEDHTIFQYKCSSYYSKQHEGGINILDPQLGIQFTTPQAQMIVSEKDQQLRTIAQAQ